MTVPLHRGTLKGSGFTENLLTKSPFWKPVVGCYWLISMYITIEIQYELINKSTIVSLDFRLVDIVGKMSIIPSQRTTSCHMAYASSSSPDWTNMLN